MKAGIKGFLFNLFKSFSTHISTILNKTQIIRD